MLRNFHKPLRKFHTSLRKFHESSSPLACALAGGSRLNGLRTMQCTLQYSSLITRHSLHEHPMLLPQLWHK
jgi:hypothetical protein